jgi:hypothetical protein
MTAVPADGTAVALQYVREELQTFRSTVHDELAGMRTGIDDLSRELRGHLIEQGPRLAVIERRLDEAEKDMAELKASKKDKWQAWLAIGIAVLSALLAALVPVLTR